MNVTRYVTRYVTRDNTRLSHRTHTHTHINPPPVQALAPRTVPFLAEPHPTTAGGY